MKDKMKISIARQMKITRKKDAIRREFRDNLNKTKRLPDTLKGTTILEKAGSILEIFKALLPIAALYVPEELDKIKFYYDYTSKTDWQVENEQNPVKLGWCTEDIFTLLNTISPIGYYFGGKLGNLTCIGIWKKPVKGAEYEKI